MGRPRKRRHVDESPPIEDNVNQVAVADSGMTFPSVLDPALGYIPQMGDDGTAYLGGLPSGFNAQNDPDASFDTYPLFTTNDFGGSAAFPTDFSGTDLLQGFDFGAEDATISTVDRDITTSLEEFMASRQAPVPEPPRNPTPPPTTPSMSSGTESALGSPEPGVIEQATKAKAHHNVICGCLSSLYLALESLTHLPADVPSALRVARSTIKVAQGVIECPQCSSSFQGGMITPVPVQSFQNMMCLSALVPSACNAYALILEMVDDQTNLAKKEDRQLYFSFKDVGGLWSLVADAQGPCSVLKAYDEKYLEPEIWRSTMRVILKLDVYGLGGKTGTSPAENIIHPQRGLKDVVDQMERTTRRRHDVLDEMIAAGKVPPHPKYLMNSYKHVPPEERGCTRMVESARSALDNLAIS